MNQIGKVLGIGLYDLQASMIPADRIWIEGKYTPGAIRLS
jgi:hypothetical protein